MIGRFWRWLNAKFGIIETDDDLNGYYAWADHRLDELASITNAAKKQKERQALERQLDGPFICDDHEWWSNTHSCPVCE